MTSTSQRSWHQGEPEQAIAECHPSLYALAWWLRQHRRGAGLTYPQLAHLTGITMGTLWDASSGKKLPSQQTVVAYAKTCGADPTTAHDLWEGARQQSRKAPFDLSDFESRSQRVPHPRSVRTHAELTEAMQALYGSAGSPPLREMTRRAAERGVLPPNTVYEYLRKGRVPQREERFRLFLIGCGVPKKEQTAWVAAWCRVTRTGPRRTTPASSDQRNARRELAAVLRPTGQRRRSSGGA